MLSEQSMDILSSSKTTTGGEGKGNGKQKIGNGKQKFPVPNSNVPICKRSDVLTCKLSNLQLCNASIKKKTRID